MGLCSSSIWAIIKSIYSGCYLRVLENNTAVCMHCDSTIADLENFTACNYSKWTSTGHERWVGWGVPQVSWPCSFFPFISLPLTAYITERTNHTTITTVLPTIGKKWCQLYFTYILVNSQVTAKIKETPTQCLNRAFYKCVYWRDGTSFFHKKFHHLLFCWWW